MTDPARVAIERVFRDEYGRVLAALISHLGDFTLAEDALQDALVLALEHWHADGVPRSPAAWLTTAAKRRAVDRLRRSANFDRKHGVLVQTVLAAEGGDEDEMMDDIPDERLKLMFTCCHPALAVEAQVALTLHTLGGLSTGEIAKAFLIPTSTMAQRLTRARAKIRDAGIPYRVPPAELLPERLDALLAVVYLIFNEGYSASSGTALLRRDLCQEAIRLCRVLVDLLPPDANSAESKGLLALLLLHDARAAARTDEAGNLILLEEQDRSLWNRAQIDEGIALLDGALRLGHPGAYQLQAAISALHAEAPTAAETDWRQIAELYGVLAALHPSPVVELNRAVAVGLAEGISAGLRLLLRLGDALEDYYPYHAARADLLRRAHELEAAADAYQRALRLCPNAAERAYFARRLAALDG